MSTLHRIYYSSKITSSTTCTLEKIDSHHLISVLRLNEGEHLALFNAQGEWLCEITKANKKAAVVLPIKQLKKEETPLRKIKLFYSPLKSSATAFLLPKATELGVSNLTQVITDRTVNKPLENEKIYAKIKEAAQQCGRLSIPKVEVTISLKNLISSLDNSQNSLFWLNEDQQGLSISQAVTTLNQNEECGFLIGPEGGFTDAEKNSLKACRGIVPVFLKGNILRAETACLAALALASQH